MALRSPDFAPGRIEAPRTPFERHRQGCVEPVKRLQKIRLGRAGRREKRVENDRLSVQAQILPLRFEFGDGQPPIHSAAGCAVPKGAGPVGEFVQE